MKLYYRKSSSLQHTLKPAMHVFTARRNEGNIVFGIVNFFVCLHDNSWTAALSSMKFCMNMYLGSW